MGGGGSYYDRDVHDGYARSSRGTSDAAEQEMSRQSVDRGLLPEKRQLVCEAESPVVYAFDVTGSMGNLPVIIYDKMPMMVGQISEHGYLQDPKMSLAAVGDIQCDLAPIQIGDFAELRRLDDWLKRIWLEGGGGGQDVESYEFTAYFHARYLDISKAKKPFFLFTGDEGFRDMLYASDLARHFGGEHQDIEADAVFAELRRKFLDNVFLIHRRYSKDHLDPRIVCQWKRVLGENHVIILGSDQSIADVTLGLFAIVTGARTLKEYLRDLKTARDKPQSDERVREVERSLSPIAEARLVSRPDEAPTSETPQPIKWL
ncbi:MAG TPA: hypothetical protein VFQ60_04850 [Patescibacteria group bacterium]|nr:hypothetical protein [Patescibacteria group bacterium]